MVVTVTGSTTNGQKLTEQENEIVQDACDMALELDAAKRKVGNWSFVSPLDI